MSMTKPLGAHSQSLDHCIPAQTHTPNPGSLSSMVLSVSTAFVFRKGPKQAKWPVHFSRLDPATGLQPGVQSRRLPLCIPQCQPQSNPTSIFHGARAVALLHSSLSPPLLSTLSDCPLASSSAEFCWPRAHLFSLDWSAFFWASLLPSFILNSLGPDRQIAAQRLDSYRPVSAGSTTLMQGS